ncbi:uncharacterized protein M6B38_189805 [Iris pallida]|uniref:Uncharacterized protein n=1 Tax=Iris pallida TaxID=29817 RepID=A0AAX6EIT5_IRIPA|nr:uncharacterized protein M6B38_189805 [Iris pallida]
MGEEKESPKEEDEHIHPPSGKRKDLLPSLTNCHSCGQTLTDLQTLDSQWRIVLLCVECLRLIRIAAKCSYCFSSLDDADGGDPPSILCRHCSFRVHASCVPRQRRLFSPSDLDPDSFACVDCCPLRSRNHVFSSSISDLTVDGLVKEAKRKGTIAARAKEKAEEKALIASTAADKAKKALVAAVTKPGETLPAPAAVAVRDEELALQLHLAMNGSQRISRGGNRGRKGGEGTQICEKVELCGEDKSFFNSWVPPVFDEPKKEYNDVSESDACKDSGSDSRVGKSGETLLKYFRRRAKSKKSSSTVLSKNGGEDTLDRYLMKYRRKSGLKAMMKREENQLTQCWQMSCSNASTLSDAPLSSLPGCQS